MSTWTTFWTKIWRGTSAELSKEKNMVKYIWDTTKNLCEPFQSLVDWTPSDSACYVDEMKSWVPVPFDNHAGRVTLVGDAAHPMLPCKFDRYCHPLSYLVPMIATSEYVLTNMERIRSRSRISACDHGCQELCGRSCENQRLARHQRQAGNNVCL